MQSLGRSAGFEVAHDAQQVAFANRATFVTGLSTWILGGLGFLFGMNGVVFSFVLEPIAIGLGMAAASAVFLAIASKTYDAYKKRRDAPFDDTVFLRADLTAGQLLNPDGTPIAPLSDVQVRTKFNRGQSTQGFMHHVLLQWPGGKATVFNASTKRAKALAETLRDLLSPSEATDP